MAAGADRAAARLGRLTNLATVTKAELESKHLSELHALAAEAGVPGYRMLPRAELIEKLLDEKPQAAPRPRRERTRPERRRRERGERAERSERPERTERPERAGRTERAERPKREERAEAPSEPQAAPRPAPSPRPEPARPARRRRRWGRRRRRVSVADLLLPATAGGQAIVYAESRERCTALLRELAAELSGATKGPDPIALLIDPSPEELADWRREAPHVELIAAGQARHVDDAVAHAARRAADGEAMILLVDSLSRFAEGFGDGDAARELYDAGRAQAGGKLTVVAAVERS